MSLAFVAPTVPSAQAPHAPALRPQKPQSPSPAAALLGVGAAAAVAVSKKPRAPFVGGARSAKGKSLRGAQLVVCAGVSFPEGRKLRVAVVGGGPAGASAADQLAKDGVETFLIERKRLGRETLAHGGAKCL